MKLPFIQHTGIGLYVTARAVRWVELARVRERVWLRRHAIEPVREETAGVRGALDRLTHRLQPDEPFVATHLPPSYVREQVVGIPLFDDESARRRWVERWAREHLPAAARIEQFVIRYHLLATSEGRLEAATPARGRGVAYGQPERRRQRCLIAMARRSAVEERAKMLRAVGLVPIYIGSLSPVIGYAFGFEASFAQRREAALLLQADGGRMGLFEEGRMVDLRMLTPAENPWGAWEAACSYVSAWEDDGAGGRVHAGRLPLYVMGEGARAVSDTLYEEERASRGVRLFGGGQAEGEGGLPGVSDGPAVGLAASLLYETGRALNLTAHDAAQAARDEREKRDALRVILLAGVGILLLWVSITGTTFWLRHRVEEAERALAQADHRIARVEAAEAALRSLQANLARARHLAQSRTRSADVLAYVSRQVPVDLWLREATLDAGEAGSEAAAPPQEREGTSGDAAALVLRGWALTEAAPGTFVAALEGSAGLRDVRLVYVERQSEEEVARRIRKTWQRPLHRFEIRLRAPLTDPYVAQE